MSKTGNENWDETLHQIASQSKQMRKEEEGSDLVTEDSTKDLVPPKSSHMLTGEDLIAKIRELSEVSRYDIAQACGYGANLTALWEAEMQAKGNFDLSKKRLDKETENDEIGDSWEEYYENFDDGSDVDSMMIINLLSTEEVEDHLIELDYICNDYEEQSVFEGGIIGEYFHSSISEEGIDVIQIFHTLNVTQRSSNANGWSSNEWKLKEKEFIEKWFEISPDLIHSIDYVEWDSLNSCPRNQL